MLDRLTVRGFKSLRDVSVELPRLTVLFGPNAAGKSNLLDAIEALSRLGVERTLSDVLDPPTPVRGHAFEAFAFPAGGLPALLRRPDAQFSIEADLTVGRQVVVTTHSPLFCDAVRRGSEDVRLFNVRRAGSATVVKEDSEMADVGCEDLPMGAAMAATAHESRAGGQAPWRR